jgi:L-rhamnose mutarotase
LKQHISSQYTIAVPLLKDNHTNYLVIDYKGKEYQRFYSLIQHLFKTLNISKYHIYKGKDNERLQVFIEVDNLTLEDADIEVNKLSDALKEKMTKRWKCLPSVLLPKEYNIVTLPYKTI